MDSPSDAKSNTELQDQFPSDEMPTARRDEAGLGARVAALHGIVDALAGKHNQVIQTAQKNAAEDMGTMEAIASVLLSNAAQTHTAVQEPGQAPRNWMSFVKVLWVIITWFLVLLGLSCIVAMAWRWDLVRMALD